MEKSFNARKLALDILCEIEGNKAYSNIILRNKLKDVQSRVDRAFITEIVYGVTKNLKYIDYVIRQFSKLRLKKIDFDILNILRMSVYQILFLDKVPDSAAVNEGINLAKKAAGSKTVSFANGVLRSVCREKEAIKMPTDPIEKLCIQYSVEEWMLKIFLDVFGDECENALKNFNEPPKMALRVNTLKIDRDALLKRLSDDEIHAEASELCEDAILTDGFDVARNEDYLNGTFTVQDIGAMLVCNLLSPKCGECVIDMCAAPGGKTSYLAQLMQNNGKVVAFDVYAHKLKLIDDMAKRMGISIIETHMQDGTVENTKWIDYADKILVDAPCSGLGIIKRKPEIKWNRTKEDILQFSQLQYAILSTCDRYLKQGGCLVYSTCTLTHEENEDVIMRFLKNHSNYKLRDISGKLPKELKKPTAESGYITLYPHIDGTDGFFMAKLMKE